MMKKRYISPVANIVSMFELESGIIMDSFAKTKVWVDEAHNMNADESYTDETFLIEF